MNRTKGLWLGQDVVSLGTAEAAVFIMATAAIARSTCPINAPFSCASAFDRYFQAVVDNDPLWRHLLALQIGRHPLRRGLLGYLVTTLNFFWPEEMEWDRRVILRTDAVLDMLEVPFGADEVLAENERIEDQLRDAATSTAIRRSIQAGSILAGGLAGAHGQVWAIKHVDTAATYVKGKLSATDEHIARCTQLVGAANVARHCDDSAVAATIADALRGELAEISRGVLDSREAKDRWVAATPESSEHAQALTQGLRRQRVLRLAVEALGSESHNGEFMPDLAGLALPDARKLLTPLAQTVEVEDTTAPGGHKRWIMRDDNWVVKSAQPGPGDPLTGTVLLACRHVND